MCITDVRRQVLAELRQIAHNDQESGSQTMQAVQEAPH
jgi:hypothetical protein